MLKLDELPHFRPADAAADVIPRGDVVLLTGSTLLNGTLEDLLLLASPQARVVVVVVVGPTVGLPPDAFLDVLAEGGSRQHFFGRSASRAALLRRSPNWNAVRTA